MRLLVDTNVLLDLVLARSPFKKCARSIFVMGYFKDAELWASARSFADVYYFARKASDAHAALRALDELERQVSICSIDRSDIRAAIDAGWDDFEDCLVYQAARKIKADCIVTRDEKGFAPSHIPFVSPDELLGFVEREFNLIYEEICA